MIRIPAFPRALVLGGAAVLAFAPDARAAFLSGEALDTAADIIAIVVLLVVPIGAVVLFWLVHILPEVIAERKHHPQKGAIKTLCLLSLVFGGMLWPLAWIWAYTRPVGYRLAYGTDKHEDYYQEMVHKAKLGALARGEIVRFKDELDDLAARSRLPAGLKHAREELEAVLAGGVQVAAAKEGR